MQTPGTVNGLTRRIAVTPITVQTKKGDLMAFLLEIHQVDAQGQDLPIQQFVLPPEQIAALSNLLQATVQAHGLEPLAKGSGPQH